MNMQQQQQMNQNNNMRGRGRGNGRGYHNQNNFRGGRGGGFNGSERRNPYKNMEFNADQNPVSIVEPGSIPCRFFNSPGGCKFGDICYYAHERKEDMVCKEVPSKKTNTDAIEKKDTMKTIKETD